jgi:hypothetical protein
MLGGRPQTATNRLRVSSYLFVHLGDDVGERNIGHIRVDVELAGAFDRFEHVGVIQQHL